MMIIAKFLGKSNLQSLKKAYEKNLSTFSDKFQGMMAPFFLPST